MQHNIGKADRMIRGFVLAPAGVIVAALAGVGTVLEGVPLRCWDTRRRISDYLDDELPEDERATIERHLETCPTCPPLYASIVGVRGHLPGLRDPDSVIPPSLGGRLEHRFGTRPAR